MRKRLTFMMLVSVFAMAAAQAAPALPTPAATPTYAILSLIGDQLEVVVVQSQAARARDRIRREPPLAIREAVFDNVAAVAAGDALKKIVPAAEQAFLNSRSAILFERQDELFEEKAGVIGIPDAIRGALQKEKATHFILIRKYRDEAQFLFTNAPDGTGMLDGMGFYLDAETITLRGDTAQSRRDFVAPFLFATVSLVEVPTSKVVNRKSIMASMPLPVAKDANNMNSAWASLSATDKMNGITRLIQREMARVVPLLLKGD